MPQQLRQTARQVQAVQQGGDDCHDGSQTQYFAGAGIRQGARTGRRYRRGRRRHSSDTDLLAAANIIDNSLVPATDIHQETGADGEGTVTIIGVRHGRFVGSQRRFAVAEVVGCRPEDGAVTGSVSDRGFNRAAVLLGDDQFVAAEDSGRLSGCRGRRRGGSWCRGRSRRGGVGCAAQSRLAAVTAVA